MVLLFLSVVGLSRITDWFRLTSEFLFVGNASKFEELLLGMYLSIISFVLTFEELCYCFSIVPVSNGYSFGFCYYYR